MFIVPYINIYRLFCWGNQQDPLEIMGQQVNLDSVTIVRHKKLRQVNQSLLSCDQGFYFQNKSATRVLNTMTAYFYEYLFYFET